MAAEQLTKGRGVFLLFIISLAVGVIGWGSPQQVKEVCNNPPSGNPNVCHVYTWNKFPGGTTGIIPHTGLFNNDTSYQFAFNMTAVASFQICADIRSDNGLNDTLTLQYLSTSDALWHNLATNGGGNPASGDGTGGSLALSGLAYPVQTCSVTLGYVLDVTPVCNAFLCTLRIAGNGGAVALGGGLATILLSGLSVQFFYTNAFTSQTNTVTCNASARSLTSFTNQCTIQIPRTLASTITFSWAANNETGAGCGLLDNCWRRNTGVTCTISIGVNVCTNVITFSPAFTITTPIIIENWSPATLGLFTIKPASSQFSLLT